MAAGYYVVNNVAQLNGDHEVHVYGCAWFPSSFTQLGQHDSCRNAVALAHQYYPRSNGCYWCSNECHTT